MEARALALLSSIGKHTYTRIGRSPIHGIGVFAIRKIPQGVNPFGDGADFDYVQVPPTLVEVLEPGVRKLLKDLCVFEDDVYWVPDYGLNQCGVGWYLNHSTTPNMGTPENGDDHGDEFFALRDIEPGEELTIDYGTYNDDLGLD